MTLSALPAGLVRKEMAQIQTGQPDTTGLQ